MLHFKYLSRSARGSVPKITILGPAVDGRIFIEFRQLFHAVDVCKVFIAI